MGSLVNFPYVCQTSDRNSQLENIMERLNKNPRCHLTTWVSKFEKYQGSVLIELNQIMSLPSFQWHRNQPF